MCLGWMDAPQNARLNCGMLRWPYLTMFSTRVDHVFLDNMRFSEKWSTPNSMVYHDFFQLQLPFAGLTPPFFRHDSPAARGCDVQVISVFPGELLVSLIESLGRSWNSRIPRKSHPIWFHSPHKAFFVSGKKWYEPGGSGGGIIGIIGINKNSHPGHPKKGARCRSHWHRGRSSLHKRGWWNCWGALMVGLLSWEKKPRNSAVTSDSCLESN